MAVDAVGSGNRVNTRRNLSSAIKTGAVAAGLQYALYKPKYRAAINNTILGRDIYIKNSERAIIKTLKDLDNAGMSNMAGKINAREAMQNAAAMFPKYQRLAKPALAALGRTFAAVATGVFIGHIIADKIFENKE